MKEAIDNFSIQSKIYKKYRPVYPNELYKLILPLVKEQNQCWDCGTGNGQVALQLVDNFEKVYATDISQNQINNARKHEKINYSVQRAEQTNFANDNFDLITVAQAIHWFDFKAFNNEVKRVSKNGGIICIWGYGLLKIEFELDKVINRFYKEIIGKYWDEERRHIDNNYESIEFEFKELQSPNDLTIQVKWKLDDLVGYLNSWSSVQKYIQQNKGMNPITLIEDDLKSRWGKVDEKSVVFPLFMRIGEIEK